MSVSTTEERVVDLDSLEARLARACTTLRRTRDIDNVLADQQVAPFMKYLLPSDEPAYVAVAMERLKSLRNAARSGARMLRPLEQWMCDDCRMVIEEPAHGYLEWLMTGHKACGFRIVHHLPHSPQAASNGGRGCYRHNLRPESCGASLHEYVGHAGLPMLLSFLDPGSCQTPEYAGPEVVSVREWGNLFRRLHLPYYEEAQLYWTDAVQDGFLESMNEVAIYQAEFLVQIIEHYGGEQTG